jgi:transcriptional regulator with XRE-family HTH domain
VVAFGARRVPGLRRSEVAQLAGMSVEYYTWMERGNLAGVSEEVLNALAAALRLDDSERSHLFDLAHTAQTRRPRQPHRSTASAQVRPSIQRLVDGLSATAAVFVRNGRLDILASNALLRALYVDAFDNPARPVNLARFVFLDPRAHLLHPNWSTSADTTVAILRTEAGRNPYDKDLTDLVGELSTRSPEFGTSWAAHNVRLHRSGRKHFHHRAVGDLDLAFDTLDLPDQPGLTFTAYSADPDTPTADNLALLACWAASQPSTTSDTAARAEINRHPQT